MDESSSTPAESKLRPEVEPFKAGDRVLFMLVLGPNRHYATGVSLMAQ
jgi:hypothetical protein